MQKPKEYIMQRTAEAVSIGHPDKIADYISSYILDRLIEQAPTVRYAVEVMVKDNTVVLGGEVTTTAPLGDLTAHVGRHWPKSDTMNDMPPSGVITRLTQTKSKSST